MIDVLEKANKVALEITNRYQNIKYKDITIPVPYFINTAELEYKKAMKSAGIDDDQIKKVIQLVKNGQTALGSFGGKGSPEDIEKDLHRLMHHLNKIGFTPSTREAIIKWMKIMHIGLDCSGYVYNILKSIDDYLNINTLNLLAWVDPKTKKSSHAGVAIFNSDDLETVSNFNLKPLDLMIFRDLGHIGIILDFSHKLKLVDCSMTYDGITSYELVKDKNKIKIQNSKSWNYCLNEDNIIVKRLRF